MPDKLKKLAVFFVVFGVLGIADAGYLTYLHYASASPFCSVFNHCDIVLASSYAVVLGIPVALIGLVYYFLIAGFSAAALFRNNVLFLKLAGTLAALGFLASLWFVALQILVLNSFCLYCLFSAALSAALFICALILAKRPRPTV